VRVAPVSLREEVVQLHVRIIDTGCGIAPEVRDRLFQKFSQGDSSVTRRHGGTGLGLAISRELTRLMGGTIGVQSEPGEGSTFWFTVALQPARAAAPADTPAGVATPAAPGPDAGAPFAPDPRPALVVEDNAINQRVALHALQKLGIAAEAVADGEQALAALAGRDYRLVLMDCQMPVLDGYAATRRLRADGQAARDPRVLVIAMTANAMQGDREACLAAGMDDYLTKPLTVAQLREVLGRWLDPAPAGATV
jgi:CheY-like chemotaxis protein